MKSLPVFNPQNRFTTEHIAYDEGEVPSQELHVYEDHTRTILATNDSPDVGFKWSVNPYRGCQNACAYCLCGDTLILMGDGRTRKLRDLRRGDAIYGTVFDGKYRRYTRTTVLDHWETFKRAYRIELHDGTELIASADHRFLTLRGWKHVIGAEQGPLQRPHLNVGGKMLGFGGFTPTPAPSAEYKRGYLCGMIRGDGSMFEREYSRPNGKVWRMNHFRLALVDLDALRRTRRYLDELDVVCKPMRVFQQATGIRQRMMMITTGTRPSFERIRELIEWPAERTREWARGFLAGIFDAEGSHSCGIFRISNTSGKILYEILECLWMFGFEPALELPTPNRVAANIRIIGEARERLRFAHLVDPAIRRKWDFEGLAIKSKADLRVKEIRDLGFSMRMFDITTGTGDFIANGVVSHNCYARPGHEYLSFSAGTDFETKIVAKPRAPELLREAFDKKSWKGELIVFSGVTDCYQPLERKMGITRKCLEICAEYRNPVGIITKSPVIERDVEILQELARVASVRVSVSVPFWDPDVAKAMEPWVTTPQRRMKIVETLAKAGIPVGVSVSPIVPGLNDEHLGEVLKAASEAGAKHAFYVLLRLPGAVKDVFQERLRQNLPLRAEKVLRRMREAHGGKLYDATYGARQTGGGQYAEMIGALFERTARRYGLIHDEMNRYDTPATFRRPEKSGQTSFGF